MFKCYSFLYPFCKLRIATHDGNFHCDEVLACMMLTRYTRTYYQADIIRTRDPAVWATCDAVVDVGGKYSPPTLLDHHQIQFQHTYPNYNIRLSSAGLVYMHYEEIIPNAVKKVLSENQLPFQPTVTPEIVAAIRVKIYQGFIMYVDANDNGVGVVNEKEFLHVPGTLWKRIAQLNPMWWEEAVSERERFNRAMDLAEQDLLREVKTRLLGSVQTKSMVKKAFDQRKEVHDSGKIILLEKYMPWQKSIMEIEEEEKCVGEILYIVYPEKSGLKWRIQAVPMKERSFELRRGLKQEWRGIKNMQRLIAVSQIKDIDFVHASGFIGGAISKQSAILMGCQSMK